MRLGSCFYGIFVHELLLYKEKDRDKDSEVLLWIRFSVSVFTSLSLSLSLSSYTHMETAIGETDMAMFMQQHAMLSAARALSIHHVPDCQNIAQSLKQVTFTSISSPRIRVSFYVCLVFIPFLRFDAMEHAMDGCNMNLFMQRDM